MRAGWMFLAVLAVGCAEDPGAGKTKAEVTEATEPAKADKAKAQAAEEAVTFMDVNVEKSKIGALGAKITAEHPIDFPKFTGKVGMASGKVQKVEFEVDMASLVADHPKLTKHLLNEDFFDVPNHPTSTFVSKKVTEGSEAEGMTHTITGDLTIRGTTKQVKFPANVTIERGEVSAKSEFVIDRQDFGVTYPGRPDDLVKDNVAMTIHLVANEAEAAPADAKDAKADAPAADAKKGSKKAH